MARNRSRRLVILGAGASYAVGLPDADRILPQLLLYLNGPIFPIPNRTPMRVFSGIGSALMIFAAQTGFREGDRFPLDAVIERFYDAAKRDPSFLPLQNLLWQGTREFVYSRSCECADGYKPFAGIVDDDDIVITFNWDICFEIAMQRIGRRVTLKLARPPCHVPWVLKPHGSVDFVIAQPGLVTDIGPRDGFTEEIHPALPPAPSPFRIPPPALLRTRTYDLAWQVETDWTGGGLSLSVDPRPRANPPTDDADVGPLHLERCLPDAGPFLLTPGWTAAFYDWSYKQIQSAIGAVAKEIRGIWVVGYSFPVYDAPGHGFLRKLFKSIGRVPVHVVNPSANSLPQDLLRSIFGDVVLHPVGFLEYDWRNEGGR